MSKGVIALRAATAATIAVVAALLGYAAALLLAYPWDWSPDEGLALANGSRAAASGIAALYTRTVVPTSDGYGSPL